MCRNVLIASVMICYLQSYLFCGINGKALTWLRNYLTNKRQFVRVNGASSSPLVIPAGIPQGSALGPLLFLIFINDLPQHIENAFINVFADESAVYTTGE